MSILSARLRQMADYLDELAVGGWPRKLIDQVMITEFGLEMGEMSQSAT